MKKSIRTLKQAYAYKKTEQTSVATVELDEFITTKEDYKAVLSLLINVLENEQNLEIHDIKCNDKTVSFKISESSAFGVEISDNEYSCNKNDMFEPRVEIKEDKNGISVEIDIDDLPFE